MQIIIIQSNRNNDLTKLGSKKRSRLNVATQTNPLMLIGYKHKRKHLKLPSN